MPLNKFMMQWFCDEYMSKPDDASNVHLSPLKATDLKGLPSATIIGAEIDPLQSEGKQYADKLREVGVDVNYTLYTGVTHDFFGMGVVVNEAKEAEDLASKDLRSAFSK